MLLFLGVLATVLMMVSAATAVPVNNGKKIIENVDKIKNIRESNAELFKNGLFDWLIDLINLTIQLIIQIVNVVQSVLGLISLIKNLINGISEIISLIQDIIDIIKGDADPSILFN